RVACVGWFRHSNERGAEGDDSVPSSDIQEITAVAVRAARAAGTLALTGFRSRELVIDLKSGIDDVVTEYDRACERLVRREIIAAYPDSTIVGEESGETRGAG